MAQIECKNLTLGYEAKRVASGISFSLEEGDYLAVVGKNGSGKTTLMKTLLGLVKPLGGEIVLADSLKRNEIGYLPQQTPVQRDFPASVYEVVISGCLPRMGIRPFYGKKEKQTAAKNIKMMGLDGKEKECYRELSGGQQQRVLLARALCATEKLLVLDEPVAGLDPEVTDRMYSLIKEINGLGITVIMISHDIAAATRDANKILLVGEAPFFGKTEQFLASDMAQSLIGLGGSGNGNA